MKPRIIFGTLLGTGALLFLAIDFWYEKSFGVFVLVTLFALWAQYEIHKMAEGAGVKPFKGLGAFLGFFLLLTWWSGLRARAAETSLTLGPFEGTLAEASVTLASEIPLALGLCLVLLMIGVLFRTPSEEGVQGVAFTAFTLLYVCFMAGFVLEHRFLDAPDGSAGLATGDGPSAVGAHAVILFLAASKSTDIFAYFSGKFLGTHRLAPILSPKKTWEGLAGGAAGSAVVALVYTRVSVLGDLVTWWQAILFGILLAVVGQCGDIAESFIKRSFGKKDSSSLIPEFGGLLDLIDGVLLTAPVSYAFFCLVGLRPG